MTKTADGEGRIERCLEAVLVDASELPAHEVRDRRQDDLRREWERGDHGPGSNRAVVGAIRHAAREVVEKPPLDSVDRELELPRSVARSETPAEFTVVREAARIADGILLLHLGCTPAVLEIVDPVFPHEGVLDAAEIDPHMGKLVRKQGSRIEELSVIDGLPFIG